MFSQISFGYLPPLPPNLFSLEAATCISCSSSSSHPLTCLLKDSLCSIYIDYSFHLSGWPEHLHVISTHLSKELSLFNERNLAEGTLVIEAQAETGFLTGQEEVPWKLWARSTMVPRPQREWYWKRNQCWISSGSATSYWVHRLYPSAPWWYCSSLLSALHFWSCYQPSQCSLNPHLGSKLWTHNVNVQQEKDNSRPPLRHCSFLLWSAALALMHTEARRWRKSITQSISDRSW